MMTIKKKKLIITIIAIVIVFTTAIIALIVLSQNMNLFKSQDLVVKEYFGQVFDRFANIVNFDYEENIYNSINEKNYESNLEIVLNKDNKDAKLKLISDSQVDNTDDYKYNYTKMSYGEEIIVEVEYLRQDEILGIRLIDLVKQYLSVKNENLDELVQKIDTFDKEKYTLPEKLYSINILQDIKMSDEEKNILKEKYIDIILKNINTKEIVTQKNGKVTVGKDTLTANSYTIIISKKELDNIVIQMLETLKTEEIILKRISNLEEIYGKLVLNQENAIKEYYIKIIDEAISNIQNSQQDYEIKFTIYSVNNSVVKINIEHELRKINFELNNSNQIIIKDLIMGEQENIKEITITKSNGKFVIEAINSIGDEEESFSITANVINDEQNIKTEISIISNEKEKKALYINNNIKFLDKIEEKKNIEDNNIIISDLDEKKLNKIVNAFTDIIKSEIPNRLKILQKALDIDITGDIVISEDGKTESEKNVFNAKFEFYAGENISKENIEKLVDVVKQNLEKIEIINKEVEQEQSDKTEQNTQKESKEIRLKILENSNYSENFEEVEKILNEAKTYKVKIEYNKDTEIIEYVTITPNIEKKK